MACPAAAFHFVDSLKHRGNLEYLLLVILFPQIHRLIWLSGLKSASYGVFLITSKALDARRRGATRLNRMGQYAARRSHRRQRRRWCLDGDQGSSGCLPDVGKGSRLPQSDVRCQMSDVRCEMWEGMGHHPACSCLFLYALCPMPNPRSLNLQSTISNPLIPKLLNYLSLQHINCITPWFYGCCCDISGQSLGGKAFIGCAINLAKESGARTQGPGETIGILQWWGYGQKHTECLWSPSVTY